MSITHFVNKHIGQRFIVCGTGVSIKDFKRSESDVVIGVNDIEFHVQPDYLVCIDSAKTFVPARWACIKETKAKAVFSHLNLPINDRSKLVKIDFSLRNVYDLASPNKLHKSYLSPYVAVNIAYWMGASEIYLIGVDLVNHPLKSKLTQINKDFKHLHAELQKKGVQLYNASSISKINTVPFKSL
jgi:hypothetical protein